MAQTTFRIIGRVVDRTTRRGLPGLRVEAWDKDLLVHDLVGSTITDAHGAFEMGFDAAYFHELFIDRRPDLFFRVFHANDLIKSTERSVLWNVPAGDTAITIEVEMQPETLEAQALRRCESGIRRLLRMSDEEIRQAKERDEARLTLHLEHLKQHTAPPEALSSASMREASRVLPHPLFGLVMRDRRRDVMQVRAILDFGGNADDLRAMGIEVRSHVHNIFTISATRRQLATLASLAATRKIKLPRLFLPELADAIPTTQMDLLHAVGTGGRGTIVGVVDFGPLEVRHYAFRDPTTRESRVKYMWVQEPEAGASGLSPQDYFAPIYAARGEPNPFAGCSEGILYDQAAINHALDLPETYGTEAGQIAKEPVTGPPAHGTAVAGIAVGNGYEGLDMPGRNIGAAPEADLIYVCLRWQPATYEDDIMVALDFLMQVAAHEGQPVVVCCSMGNNLGPHNGRTEFDQFRDALLDSHQGRAMVFPSCNYNRAGFRRGAIAGSGETVSFDLRRHSETGSGDIWLDIWYRGPAELAFKMDCAGGSTEWQAYPDEFDAAVGGYVMIVERNDASETRVGLHNLRLYIQSAERSSPCTVNLRHDAATESQYWAWVGIQGSGADVDGYTADEMTLGDSGCCRSILTVGACYKAVAGPEPIYEGSGCGPTLDGRVKPEIVTVGEHMASAWATTTGTYERDEWVGTSFSAPLVAGAVALLFEGHAALDQGLNQDALKTLLAEAADRTDLHNVPEDPGYDPIDRNRYGYGRLRMQAPFEHVLPPGEVDVCVRTAADDFGAEPYIGDCFCHAPEVTVYDAHDRETTTLHWGEAHTLHVRIHNLGDLPAFDTVVRLKYTRPWTAPDVWMLCTNAAGADIAQTVEIPPLGSVDVVFHSDEAADHSWVPREDQVPPVDRDWEDHYCLLVEVEHASDAPGYFASDGTRIPPDDAMNAWNRNIKSTNNVALLNLHIQT